MGRSAGVAPPHLVRKHATDSSWLIVTAMGATAGIFGRSEVAVMVAVVLLTTLLTPLALRSAFNLKSDEDLDEDLEDDGGIALQGSLAVATPEIPLASSGVQVESVDLCQETSCRVG